MLSKRSDLLYGVTKLVQHLSAAREVHLNHVQLVLQYQNSFSLKYFVSKKTPQLLPSIGFCNANWGASRSKLSITGYGFQLSKDRSLVAWKRRK